MLQMWVNRYNPQNLKNLDFLFLEVVSLYLNQLSGADAETAFVKKLEEKQKREAEAIPKVKPSKVVSSDVSHLAKMVKDLTSRVPGSFRAPKPSLPKPRNPKRKAPKRAKRSPAPKPKPPKPRAKKRKATPVPT